MSKVWTNGGSLVISGGTIVLCDTCPCEDVIADTGTGTSVAVDLSSGIAVLPNCDCTAHETIALNTAYEVDFLVDDPLCTSVWFKIPACPVGFYRMRINVLAIYGFGGSGLTAGYGVCGSLTTMFPVDTAIPAAAPGTVQCLNIGVIGLPGPATPGPEDVYLGLHVPGVGEGFHIVFDIEHETEEDQVCP